VLRTPQLELRLQTPAETLAWVESLPPDVRAEVSPEWIARVQSARAGDVWRLGFSVHDARSGQSVGSCAFKAPPDDAGVVEIAYGIDEAVRGRGYASQAAGALVAYCVAHSEVVTVRAHTKHDNAASIAVLRRCGFTLLGEVMDPEDGLLLRWERPAVAAAVV
jgi:[ribosomal protein S5]-alanine N-acetyltransferase